jgi:hypothetical protein
VGTIREQNPTINFDNGVQNFGFYRDDDEITLPAPPPPPPQPSLPPTSSSQHLNWIELRSPPTTTSNIINTARLSPADYEIRSYPTDDYHYTHQSLPPRPTIIDFRQYRNEYDDDDRFRDDDDELENFQFHSLRRPDLIHTHIQRTDTSTESFAGNYSTLVPKSILKGSTSTTPPPDLLSTPYSQTQRSRTPSKFDESPRISVKINTDESIPIDYPTSAIEKIIPNDSIISINLPSSLPSTLNRMRFASVSQLNEVEWEVPSEFQTIVYDLSEDRQPLRGALIYSSTENLNNNNNNNNNTISNDNEKLSTRQRSQSADVDQRTHVSRIFVPWDREKKIFQPLYLANNIEQGNTTQQQAFEY